MTEPLIKLPSMIIKELQAEIAVRKTKLEGKETELKRKRNVNPLPHNHYFSVSVRRGLH